MIVSQSDRDEFEALLKQIRDRTGADVRDLASKIYELGYDRGHDQGYDPHDHNR